MLAAGRAAEYRMAAPQLDQSAGECQQPAVHPVPIEPRQRPVLTIRVVVAALRASDLVAGKEHRDALREKQGGKEVLLLTVTQRQDRRIGGRPLDAAVP